MLNLSVKLSGITNKIKVIAFFLLKLAVICYGITKKYHQVSIIFIGLQKNHFFISWLVNWHRVKKSPSLIAPHVPVHYGKPPVLLILTTFSLPAEAENLFGKIWG